MKDITIRITKAHSDLGYFYDIYTFDAIDQITDEEGSDNGGQCTTSMKNAIDMACEQAKSLINNNKTKLCTK